MKQTEVIADSERIHFPEEGNVSSGTIIENLGASMEDILESMIFV